MSLEEITNSYSPPVDRLLTLGDRFERSNKWPDYLKYGFTLEHLPDLIRLAEDERINDVPQDDPVLFASMHVIRTLGQLGADECIAPLVRLLRIVETEDWACMELPEALKLIGASAVPALVDYLQEPQNGTQPRITAAAALTGIAEENDGSREACVTAIANVLKQYESNDPELNGYLVCNLGIDLRADETLPVIQEAYARKCVDLSIAGTLENLEVEMGVRPAPPNAFQDWISPTPLSGARTASPPAPGAGRPAVVSVWSKAGRNDPCPCGSGVKFKKCCLPKVQSGQLR